ncbi:SDR family NAD(P)-dependent oxidoreductase [Gammaproteobacteria bacterium]|nr:SDR family NAD(P)-dependent oxidoreductase [Gammaproteobacteria bacterium]MDA9340553.1 SDR family NAD(P)-dependent oxidoreductase [Gammaproteobacteria bacterium]MDB9700922.1 SDR family NAD(P)-dependent oxidoreductase [Gammaproteobacteria bacterium]MDC0014841.1 SDR family NAD(P)-dependent oxidoreductase [Gammaproteobacteria bacterium]MDC1301056.1 SDR family NAD(P)-dependent oxidoreductase [Gammaproteobacteria bacterium]|tara:strand:+ start:972 stop:1850 length:879 start_codon:yes stop_codon:yes gene_type:complete
MENFTGKLAVVTGAASGVGLAISTALAKEGAKVILTDIEASSLEAAAKALTDESLDVYFKVADVSSPDSMMELADWCASEHGPVHLLFNNAGVAPAELLPIWETKPNDWQWAYSVNVMGVLHGIQAFVPGMLAHGQASRVINTCSGNGAFINLPSTPIYTSSKASVSSITEVLKLQLEQAESSVKVSILFPGPHTVRTKLFSAERNRPEELARDPNAPVHPISSVEDMLEMMSSMGIEMETTEPEEVASFCLGEIKKGNYWINPENEKSEQAFKDRVDSILSRSDLPNPNIF